MEMTISPQEGNGCNGSNENQSRLERQLEWSRRIGIDELKRIYGASLFLRCTAYLFFMLAMLAFCGAASIVFDRTLPEELRLYPEWTLLLPGVLLLTQYLKTLKIPSLCRKTITILQIGLVIAIGYFFLDFIIYYLLISFKYRFFYGLNYRCRNFLKCIFLFILLKMCFDMLWNGRSRKIRIFLIVMSLVWGIIGGLFFPLVYAILSGVLMAGILWIAAFSKVRNQLFRDDTLSHNQLYAVLGQRKRNVPDEELVIPEDHKDFSRKKFRRGVAWFFLAVLVFETIWYNQEWFLRKAAELGYAKAQFNLGVRCYREIENYSEALKWFRKAAEQGHAKAQYFLGWIYFNGQHVKQDYIEAAKWFRFAAEQRNAQAQFGLGTCYAGGLGVQQDYAEAVKWYRKSADNESADLKREYRPLMALNLAETYIILGEYDRAIAYLDDLRLQQDQDDEIRCLRAYFKICILLATGQNAGAEIWHFNTFHPYKMFAWNVIAFRLWLKRADLSDQARKTIAEMTDQVAYRK